MAKDFVDTQTGGEGATAQTGNLSTSESMAQAAAPPTTSKRTRKGLKKQARQDKRDDRQRDRKRRREDRKEDREDRRDYRKEERKYGGRVKDSEEDDLPQEEVYTQGAGIRVSQTDGQLNEEDLVSAEIEDDLEPETPMVQPLASLDSPEQQSDGGQFNFSVGPEEEPVESKYDDKGNFNFSTGEDDTGMELLSLPEGMKPYEPNIVDPQEEEEEIYVYGNSPNEYVIRDGRWWAKTPNQSEFQPIIGKKSRARAMGLNDKARSKKTGKTAPKVELPESTFKPKRGAFTEVEGAPIYQMPGNIDRLYTVRDNEIYVLQDGDKEWNRMEDTESKYDIDTRIKSFNDFHGMSIPTKSELKKKQAQIDAKNAAPMSTTAEAGEALKERQADFEDVNLDIRYDEDGDAIISAGDGSDLFGVGSRPKSNVHTFNQSTGEQYEWDSKYGPLLPASQERVELAKIEKNNANQGIFDQVSDWVDDVKFNEEGYPIAETIVLKEGTPIGKVNVYNDLMENYLPGFDEKIKQEEKAVETWNESFKNRSDYISKNGLPNVSNNYLQDLERRTRYDNYGMYQEDAVERVNEALDELRKYKREQNKSRLERFANRDLDEWNLTNNLGKEQLDQLKGMQEQIRKGGAFMFDDSGYMERSIKDFIEESFEINNKLGDAQLAGQDLTDYILDNRKIAYSDAKKAGLISDEVADVFESTMNLREFMQPYIDRGYIDVDEETGRYEISPDTPQMEREYIESQLDVLTNKYDNAKSKIYIDNTKAIEKLQKDLKSKKAAIKRANQGLKEGKVPKEQMKSVSAELNQLDQEIKDIESKIDELRQNNVITFQTDPKKMAAKMSGLTTQSSEAILRALPQDATGFHKFALFYENLKKRTERMKYEYKISDDYWDRVGEKVRDMLDIGELGLGLSSKEVEYFKNQALLQQALPLYLNNDWGITEESAGFWDSFMNSLYGTVFPNTSKAYGFYNETEMASADMKLMEAAGLSEVDFADAATMEKLQARLDVDFWSSETWGNMVGTSTAIMMAIIGGGGIMSGGVKGGKAVISLLDKYKKAKKTADAIKDLKRITNSYHKSLKATRLGRFALESTKSGIQFEVSSTFNTMDDELNFLSGLGGAMGAKIAGGIFGKLKVSEGIDWLTGIFGSNSTRAAQVFKNIGNSSWGRTMKAANYRGLGEMPEEFSQELVAIYRDELRTRGFFEEVFNRYVGPAGENMDALFELAMASYVLGASMGTALSTTQQDYYESLSPAKKKILQQAQKEVTADMLSASVDADMTAEQISREFDAKLDSEVRDIQKQREDAVQEQQTEKVDVDEQARDGREVDERAEEDQEAETTEESAEEVVADSVEDAQRLWDEGYRADGVDIRGQLEGMFATGRKGLRMTKPVEDITTASKADFQDFIAKAKEDGLTLDEAAARAEEDGTFEDDINFQEFVKNAKDNNLTLDEAIEDFQKTESIADRLRSLKIKLPQDRMYSLAPIPVSVINGAIEVTAKGIEAVEKFMENVQNSKWYNELKSKNPDRAKKAEDALRGLIEDQKNKEGAKRNQEILNKAQEVQSLKEEMEQDKAYYDEVQKKYDDGDKNAPIGFAYGDFKKSEQKYEEALKELDSMGELETKTEMIPFGEIQSQEKVDAGLEGSTYKLTNSEGDVFYIGHRPSDVGKGKRWYISDSQNFEDYTDSAKTLKEAKKILENVSIAKQVPVKRVKPTEAVKSIKEKIAQFRRGFVEGQKKGKRDTKADVKAKKEAVEQIQKELIDYVTQNLPAKKDLPEGGSYNKQDIKTMMSKIRNAKPENLEAAIDAVDKIVNRFAEQERKNTAKRVAEKFKNPQIKKRGEKKVSRISKQAREDIATLGEQIGIDNIPSMTQEDLDALEETVDNMIAGGKSEIKAKEQTKAQEKRENRAVPMDILSRQQKKKRGTVKGETEIKALLSSNQGVVVYDGQKFSGASTLDIYLKNKGEDLNSIGEVEAIFFDTSKIFAEQDRASRNLNKAKERVRKTKDTITEVAQTFDNKLEWIYRGSKTLRDWTNKNLIAKKNKAYRDKANGVKEKKSKVTEGMNKIWGKSVINGLPKGWSNDSGITIKAEERALTNGQLVNAYMMSLTGAKNIYEVNGALYINPRSAKNALKESMPGSSDAELNEALVDNVIESKWNPDVLKQMSPDFPTSGELSYGALEKAREIEYYIEVGDGKLSQTVDLLRSSFDEMRADYEPVFEEMYDLSFKESGTYFPLTRSNTQEMQIDVLSDEAYSSAASAMADQLKQRHHSTSAIDFGYDALSKTYNYISQMEHAKAFMPVAESMRDLMNPSTRAMIIEKIGPERTAMVQEHMNRIINNGESTGPRSKVIDFVASHTVVTTLMLKTASIPKQMTSMLHYYGAGLDDGVGSRHVAYQTARILGNSVGLTSGAAVTKIENMMAKEGDPLVTYDGYLTTFSEKEIDVLRKALTDAFLSDRISSIGIDLETKALIKDIVNDSDAKVMYKKLQRLLLFPTVLGDAAGVVMGGIPYTLATYNNNVKNKDMSHEEAMDDAITKFVSVSEKTQQSRREDIVTAAQRNPAYRLFLTYTTSQVAAASQVISGLKVLRGYAKNTKDPVTGENEYTGKEAFNAFRKVAYFSTLGNLAFNVVSGGYLGMFFLGLGYDEDDTEEERQRKEDLQWTALYDSIGDMISSDLQGYGIPGKLVDGLINEWRGRGFFNEIPVIKRLKLLTESTSDYVSLISDLNELHGEDKITDSEYWDSVLPEIAGGELHGITGRQLDRPEKMMDNFYEALGIKNVNMLFDVWEQYTNEEDGKDLGFWDAFMNRKIEDDYETGEPREDVYTTARERLEMAQKRGDDAWLYRYLGFGEEPERGQQAMPTMQKEMESGINAAGKDVEKIQKEMAESLGVNVLKKDIVDASASGQKGVTEGSLEYKKKFRTKDEILKRIETERAWETRKQQEESRIKTRINESPDVELVEDKKELERIDAEKQVMLESNRSGYKEVTGLDPDPSWDSNTLRDKIIDYVMAHPEEFEE